MQFSDLALSTRLERAEGRACTEYVEARRRLFPDCDSIWMECDGVYAAYDGPDSPLTQTFGLGLFAEPGTASFETIEQFFIDRAAPVFHEVSPLAGIPVLDKLCARGYRPVEASSVMYRPVERPAGPPPEGTRVRVITAAEAQQWSELSARGWTQELPELRDFVRDAGFISASRQNSPCFLGELRGEPAATAMLCIHEGIALFAGASTVPEMRRLGMQAALLQERMRYAADHGCDLAMMAAHPGSDSQRNAERCGFRIAYTRIKWRLGA